MSNHNTIKHDNNKHDNNKHDNNKIIISNADIITNGSTSQYHLIQNPNEIGIIMDKNNTKVSEITPLIMILNQNSKNCQDKVNEMIIQGADPNMQVQYWGESKSAMDIINTYRKTIKIEVI